MTRPASEPVQLVFDRPLLDSAQAARLAARHWAIEGSIAELPSERDRNFLIETATGDRWVLKVASAIEDRTLLALQHQALRRIREAEAGLLVPEVRSSTSGADLVTEAIDGKPHYLRMLSWVPGSPLAVARPKSPALLRSLGRLLGRVDRALIGMDHPAGHRSLKWDLARAAWIEEYFPVIESKSRRALVERHFRLYQREVVSRWSGLPAGLIHNDANDYNVLVAGRPDDSERPVGLIDFGDMVWTARVAEVAIAAAYAMLPAADPVAAAAAIVSGYHEALPLSELELEVCYPLILARLAVSVVNSALQQRAMPGNDYLVISEAPAWSLLEALDEVHPRLAHYRLRDAVGLEPCPAAIRIRRWIESHKGECHPLMATDQSDRAPLRIDLSVSSPLIDRLTLLADEPRLTTKINGVLAEAGTRIGIGEYDEARLVYTTEQYETPGWDGPEWRTIHIGLDLFAPAGTPVHTPIAGRVHGVRNNAAPADYGPTVIIEHAVRDADGPLTFYTLYGHLDVETLRDVSPGQPLLAGATVGRLGTPAVNGGWPPHVHFQVIADLLGRVGEFPGVARPSERRVWKSLAPDPHGLAGFADFKRPALDGGTIAERRDRLIGPNLSVSYRRPLHIVRGWMQHLYDADGRRYLDCVNNVPHVGHCHPAVVEAGQRQMAILNTNTRYLHETMLRYAERLTATLPDPLRVSFFVNSGSEANELALRLAWTHTGRRGTIVVDGAYHGNTSTLVEISPYKCEGPGGRGLATYARKVPLPDCYRGRVRGADTGPAYAAMVDEAIESLARAGQPVGAFICESILSCGGQIVLPPGYLADVYRRVRAGGGVTIADEVQVGFGRVGTHFWGFQTQGVVPDIVVMGKPAGNGHPLGVVVTTPEIARSFANGMEYFSTFGGNPVSCAIGLAVLDVIERERLQWRALETGNYLLARLKDLQSRHEAVGDVRGLGLFVGVELVTDKETRTPDPRAASYLANRLRDRGVLLSTDGPDHNVLKIKPPMVFGIEDGGELVGALEGGLEERERGTGRAGNGELGTGNGERE